ncbi:uncharacterized protein LOC112458616 [Temnothorax curvispinosus]|uniref:Uncharacterized protein LOC112458616 n=1 Tax=Temnothorax curvispinosus TaxID=300111 RepID=A0A6J1QBG7_9HYME|nr:uncharacterized protein LOC112458616 [Temnothorax curvispinosus]
MHEQRSETSAAGPGTPAYRVGAIARLPGGAASTVAESNHPGRHFRRPRDAPEGWASTAGNDKCTRTFSTGNSPGIITRGISDKVRTGRRQRRRRTDNRRYLVQRCQQRNVATTQ